MRRLLMRSPILCHCLPLAIDYMLINAHFQFAVKYVALLYCNTKDHLGHLTVAFLLAIEGIVHIPTTYTVYFQKSTTIQL